MVCTLLSGHTDVVPAVGEDWTNDPFEMVERDGTVAFTNVNDDVRGLMRIMNLEAVFSFVDDEAELVNTSP